jgi:hypothetical protein
MNGEIAAHETCVFMDFRTVRVADTENAKQPELLRHRQKKIKIIKKKKNRHCDI